MPGGGGGGGSQTTTQQVNTNMGPWNEQGPYLKQGFAQAGNLLMNTDPKYYPGFTTAQPNHWQNIGLEGLANTGAQFGAGNPLNTAANKTALDTIQGGFLDPSTNPWLKKTFSAGADDVTRAYQTATAPQTAANFSGSGRYGSPGYRLANESNERTLGSTLDNLATSIYGGNYQQERNRQAAQTNNVGGVISSNFLGPSALLSAGGQRQALDQPNQTDLVNRWNVEQNPAAQWEELAKYMALVGSGNWGQSGQTTSFGTQPARQGGDPFAMGLGGLLSAGSLAGQLGWAPFAAGAGGASSLGGLLAIGAASDRRLKTDIKKIGMDEETGLDLYAYRYKGDPKDYPKVVGPMAQDIEEKYPDEVTEVDGRKLVSPAFMSRFVRPAAPSLGWRPFG